MAPEQFRGYSQGASDQYALAVVVYEWLTDTPPFTEGNFIQLGFQHNSVPVPSLCERVPTLSPEVEQVVMKALAKDPRERFESVSKFAEALEQACQSMLEAGEGSTSPLPPKELSPSSPIPSLSATSRQTLYNRTSVFGERDLSESNLFEVDRYFLTARKYRSFRTIGITLNILSSLLLGLWFQSWIIGIGCLVLGCLVFILCIVLVRRSFALSFAVALSVYWGGVGWVFTSAVLSLPYVNTVPVPPIAPLIIHYLVSLLSFITSLYLHASYVRNKNALQK
jgi:serine/threonine protein kinase